MTNFSRILLTGGAGFIGSHLLDRLLAGGAQVVVIDDLSTGRRDNLVAHESDSNFEMIVDSVLNERRIEQLVRRCDKVFHLASAVGVKLIMDQPVKTIETIVNGTDIVLRHCARMSKPVVIT
jgi:UDP-glucose 4-epimerase